MISLEDLEKISKARLKDAKILFKNKRYDGAVYICGYVIETFLKLKICQTLNWLDFPSSNKEFEELKSFKTHKLDTLLSLSGAEIKIRTNYLADWSIIVKWDPEVRYKPIGSASKNEARNMINSTKNLIKVL